MRLNLCIIFLIVTTGIVSAQQKFTEFHAGALVPYDAKTGFIGGLSFGRMLDENIGWGAEIDVYRRTYTQEENVAQNAGEVNETVVETEIENATTMIPLLFKVAYLTQAGPGFDLRISVGAGYEFMWNSEVNYLIDKEKSRFYSGWVWQVGAGISIPISRAADFFGEVNYHSGFPSRDEGKTDEGLPVRTEVDMSGMMLRLGLRLYSFGF
jgi:hypothetical protein